jgi:hypothetical protein
MYENAEIGYGSGESRSYAMQECKESIPEIYAMLADEITFSVRLS